jgi:hypothetical protein
MEKEWAMERALAFEDDPPQGPFGKDATMIDQEDIIELNDAAEAYQAAEDRFREICRKVGEGGQPAQTVPDREPRGTGHGQGQVGKQTRGSGRRKHVEGDLPAAGVTKQYWMKVDCPTCGEKVGSRLYQGGRFPILHKNPDSGEPCKGSFIAVAQKE